ncbi:MAG: [FeFe] hydrogenase, group A [Clostridiales bacterium]|jgi:NADH-quinone oxidoreductase subunit G|nr:[FeFe] hydrogenase, group A [Clostridiales bacterium]
MGKIKITINNTEIEVEEGSTILDCAKEAGAYIPTLCHLNLHVAKMVNQVATCRICMVDVEGRRNLAPACDTVVTNGMKISTHTKRAILARRKVLELLLSNHPKDCLSCDKNLHCELQSLADELKITDNKYDGKMSKHEKDVSSFSITRDPNKCILCRRCENMCNNIQTVGVYSAVNRGFDTTMSTAFNLPMTDTCCTFCGQCISVCPTGALTQVKHQNPVWDEINNPDKFVIVQTAPAVRVALGEEFGMPAGSIVTGKMVAALRRLGFDKVYDTDFAADLTIMEEASELIHRVKEGGPLPILTSCCPAWVKFIEHQFPELLEIPSSCKSPHEMFGAIAKTYLAEKLGVDPSKIVVVSVMPCVAKKYEANRPELKTEEYKSVDYVISTRELANMIREAGLYFSYLPDEDFDNVMGESTGAGVIFGTTGGVIEAAMRTAYCWLTGEKPPQVEFEALRGFDGIREATYTVNGQDLKIAIASGLGNSRKLLEAIRDKKATYHAIEIMACPNGCVNGGGQPYNHEDSEAVEKRTMAIYEEDRNKEIRYSHENAEIQQLYKEFLGEPYGEKAHKLLHTTFEKRGIYS